MTLREKILRYKEREGLSYRALAVRLGVSSRQGMQQWLAKDGGMHERMEKAFQKLILQEIE